MTTGRFILLLLIFASFFFSLCYLGFFRVRSKYISLLTISTRNLDKAHSKNIVPKDSSSSSDDSSNTNDDSSSDNGGAGQGSCTESCGAVKDCGDVGTISLSYGTLTLVTADATCVGCTANVDCNVGYEASTDVISCVRTPPNPAMWQTASCTIIGCGPPDNLDNGEYSYNEGATNFEDTADVSCDSCYTPSTATITCLSTGTWTEATCELKECPGADITNGNVCGATCGNSGSVNCDTGFKASEDFAECLESGDFDTVTCTPDPATTCTKAELPGTVANGKIVTSSDVSLENAVASVFCEPGYAATPTELTCTSGSWVPSAASCNPINVGFGEECEFKFCETPNAVCHETCTCDDGYYHNTVDDECQPKLDVGVACPQIGSCSDPNAECSGEECTCNAGFFKSGTACSPLKCIGDECGSKSECKGEDVECSGTPETCRCPQYYIVDQATGNCEPLADLGDSCSSTNPCKDANADCQTTCQCKTDFFKSGEMCVPMKCIGEKCGSKSECKGEDVECSGTPETCRCPQYYIVDQTTGNCEPQVDLDNPCSSVEYCKDANAICSTNCVCDTGFFKGSDGICVPESCVGEPCSTNGDCNVFSGSECSASVAGVCECPGDKVLLPNGKCQDPVGLDEACTLTEECGDKNAVCLSLLCKCDDGYENNSGTCEFVCSSSSQSDYGGECETDCDCSDPNGECSGASSSKTCGCKSPATYDGTAEKCLVPLSSPCIPDGSDGRGNCNDAHAVCNSSSDACVDVCECAYTHYSVGTGCDAVCTDRPTVGDTCDVPESPCDEICLDSRCIDDQCSTKSKLNEECDNAAISCAEFPRAKCETYASLGINNPNGGSQGDKICVCKDDYITVGDICICRDTCE